MRTKQVSCPRQTRKTPESGKPEADGGEVMMTLRTFCVLAATAFLCLPCKGVSVDVRVRLAQYNPVRKGVHLRGEAILLECEFLHLPQDAKLERSYLPDHLRLFAGRFVTLKGGTEFSFEAMPVTSSTHVYAPSNRQWLWTKYLLPTEKLPPGKYELRLEPIEELVEQGLLRIRSFEPSSFDVEIAEPATREELSYLACVKAMLNMANVFEWRLDVAEKQLLEALKNDPRNQHILLMAGQLYSRACVWDRALKFIEEDIRVRLGKFGSGIEETSPLYGEREYVRAAVAAGVAKDEAEARKKYEQLRADIAAWRHEAIEAMQKKQAEDEAVDGVEDIVQEVEVDSQLQAECLMPLLGGHTLGKRGNWWPGFAAGLGAGALLAVLCFLAARFLKKRRRKSE